MNSLSSTYVESRALVTGRSLRWLAVVGLFLLGCCFQAFAQEATIVGTVTDQTGAALPKVAVTATNAATGKVSNTTSNDDGQYVLPGLALGQYTLKAQGTGFKVVEQKNIVLNVGDRIRIDFQMQVGATSESITVEANVARIQTETGEMSSVVTGQQVSQLATNGRSLLSLYGLTTGASSLQSDFGAITPVSGDNAVSFNGGRVAHSLMMIDGGENLDRGGTGVTVMPSIDSIAEFRIQTSSYSAEYGLASAANITTALKSGTKTFHGAAWEFNRNDAMQARDFTHPKGTKPAELRLNNFGFNIGGPLPMWKDSHPTFFFYNMEWRRLIQGATLNTIVPLQSTYGGDFTEQGLTTAQLHAPFSCLLSTAEQARFTDAGQALSGCTGGAPDNALAVPFNFNSTDNVINPAFLSGNAQSLLFDARSADGKIVGIFPKETVVDPNGTPRFLGGAAPLTTVREELVRIDHQFNSKFSIFGHFIAEQISQGFATTQWSGDNVPTVGDTMGNPSYSWVAHATHIINPNLVNEISFNYNGNRINIAPTGVVSAPDSFTFNRIFNDSENALNRIPSINLSGSSNYTSNWTPWVNKADDYQIRDDVSLTRGAHQFKFGGSWALYKKNQDIFTNTQGNFTFNGRYTGSSFADFLLGYAQAYNEAAIKDSGFYKNLSYAFYFQDNWRVNNRLTLNLGLRWDGIPHTYEANHRLSSFYPERYNPALAAVYDPSNFNVIKTGAGGTDPAAFSTNPNIPGVLLYTNGLGIDGKGRTPSGLVQNHWGTFGPRLGFAYDVSGAGKTVVRGGFGVSYDRIQGNDMYNAGGNVPFSSTPSVNDVFLEDPKTVIGGTNQTISIPTVPAGITGLSFADNRPPIAYQYNFGLQQQLGTRAVFEASYVGSMHRNLNVYQEINLPDQSLLPSLQTNQSDLNNKVPFKGYRGIRLSQNVAEGDYNSFQTSVRGQLIKDLNLQIGYTLSRSEDPTTGTGSGADLQNVSNPYVGWKYDQGPSLFDRTHVAFINFVYDLPVFRSSSNHLAKSVLGGWQVSGIITAQTGTPLNLTVGQQNACSVVFNCGGLNRPNVNGNIRYVKEYDAGGFKWFDPTVFSLPTAGTFGNLPHNALRGPGRHNWNLSLFKTFTFTERVRFELRAESFNTWNHLQFGAAGANGGVSVNTQNGNFGYITNAFDPRTLQLGGKILF
jgi:hypothetical protein